MEGAIRLTEKATKTEFTAGSLSIRSFAHHQPEPK
jgi:hypothetical protein